MKLVKTSDDKVLFGVCGGVARYFGIDTALVRIGFALASLLGVGSPVIVYLIMAIIMPSDERF